MQKPELESVLTIEDARKTIEALLKTNRQLIREIEDLKYSLKAEKRRTRLWRQIAVVTTLLGLIGWGLWMTT